MSFSAERYLDLLAPEFQTNPDKADWLSMGASRTNTCFYGANSNQAIALMTAHLMALALLRPGGADGGAISSKKEGDLSVGFAASSNFTNDDLNQTKYGVQLQGLRKGSGAFLGVTGGLDNGCR